MIWTLLLLLQIPAAAWGYRSEMTRSAYRVHGPTAPVATLAAQIHQESGWKATARSWVGAQGLAQFMPATATDMARSYPGECAPANPFSPKWAFTCRDRFLSILVKAQRRGPSGINAGLWAPASECSVWAFGLGAYNGGGGWTNRDRRLAATRGLTPNDWRVVGMVNAGRSAANKRENKEYPERIYRIEARYRTSGWGEGLECYPWEVPT